MKVVSGQVTLGDKNYDSTKIDFDDISSEEGSIVLGDKEYSSKLISGIDNDRV